MNIKWGVSIFLLLLFVLKAVEGASFVRSFTILNENQQKVNHKTNVFRTNSWHLARRGASLTMRILLDSAVSDGQSLTLQVAPYSIFDPASISITETDSTNSNSNSYDISGKLADDAPIGAFTIGVRLTDKTQVVTLPKQLVVLFNPWNPADETYYPKPADLDEYIFNEHGMTYRGNSRYVQAVRWYWGQFDHNTVRVLLHLINRLDEKTRKDPALVARFLTSAMTQQETNPDGLMVGRWETTYPGGTNPLAWTSSDQIINRYIAQGFRPVLYSQCWVFAAVLNSFLRAVGIASRHESNFDSAHEIASRPQEYEQEIKRFWDAWSRRMVAEIGQIWNFHAWNGIYLRNKHSLPEYQESHWHKVDGTPQEFSGDRFQLGPASTIAVKAMVKTTFDTSFVMSEVSARIRNYNVRCPWIPAGKLKYLPQGCVILANLGLESRTPIGSLIVTKQPFRTNWNSWTITNLYHGRRLGVVASNIGGDVNLSTNGSGGLFMAGGNRGFNNGFNNNNRFTFFNVGEGASEEELDEANEVTGVVHIDVGEVEGEVEAREGSDGESDEVVTEALDEVLNIMNTNTNSPSDVKEEAETEPVVMVNSHRVPQSLIKSLLITEDSKRIHLQVMVVESAMGEPINTLVRMHCLEEDESEKFRLGGGEDNDEYDSLMTNLSEASNYNKVVVMRHGNRESISRESTSPNPSIYEKLKKMKDDKASEYENARVKKEVPVKQCVGEISLSLRLQLHMVNYNGQEVRLLADTSATALLEADNEYTQTVKFIKTDYLVDHELNSNYIRASVFLTDSDSVEIVEVNSNPSDASGPPSGIGADGVGAGSDVGDKTESSSRLAVLANVIQTTDTGFLTLPPLHLSTSRTTLYTPNHDSSARSLLEVTGEDFDVFKHNCLSLDISYTNPFNFDLTDVSLSVSADGLGFDQREVSVGVIEAYGEVNYEFSVCAIHAIRGEHFITATITSTQIEPTHSSLRVRVDPEVGASGETEEGEKNKDSNAMCHTHVWDGDLGTYIPIDHI